MKHEVPHKSIEGGRLLQVQPVVAALENHLRQSGSGTDIRAGRHNKC